METPKTAEFAHIGKSVIIKGELSGSEDLYVDGQVEGSIELAGNRLIIGPHGQVRANVNAKGVIVQGKLDGNIRASERVELTKSAIARGRYRRPSAWPLKKAHTSRARSISREKAAKTDAARPAQRQRSPPRRAPVRRRRKPSQRRQVVQPPGSA